ncbi:MULTISPECIES: uroporphyrinogen-III C-methyltransferase [unclassified Microbulbifer]|uniref:uroporphyrinogen-III C-methyltransferase n=1 Tax=unclassified Microbulbifer TaxID=2619833 RepID=UPI0027E59FE7|nr:MULTISPECIES: uroporphyrinogen-III C-methyltransferase [unclassified Microbulbifer]
MTDEKSTNADKSQNPPEAAGKPQPKSNFAKAQQGKGTAKAARKRGGGRAWLWLLLLALLGAAGTWGWLNWPQVQERLAQYLDFLPGRDRQTAGVDREEPPAAEPLAPREPPQPQDTPPATTAPPQDSAALRNQLRQQGNTIRQLQQQLAELQRSVTAQGNRLGELGNIGRQDWQLAEADYLLRLANQRLLMERDSRAALGLVEEADEILRDVNLPDLYGVRQQLASDLTALKLVENIDREGLYLRLRALEEQLMQVDIRPEFDLAKQDAAEEETPSPAGGEKLPVWERSWQNFTQFMRNSYRIRDADIDPVLLSPQSEARFRQNLRLNMEQAELALLREDDTVYKDSLARARQLLLEYGTDNHRRQVLARELQELAQQPVTVELPSLSASQSALHNYIERLHKAAPQRPPATPAGGNSDSEETGSPETETPNTAGDEIL